MFLLDEDREVLGGVSEKRVVIKPLCADMNKPTTNWYHELDLPGAHNAAIMRKIVLSLPSFFTRVPDQTLIASPTWESDMEAERGDSMISAMRGKGWCAVHLPRGGKVLIHLHKALKIGGTYRAWSIDPNTGGKTLISAAKTVSYEALELNLPLVDRSHRDRIVLVEQVWEGAILVQ